MGILLLSSCSTDVDINAEPKDITIVYGILDINDTVHYVKINKAFLGEKSAYELAKDRSLSEYDTNKVSASITQVETGVVYELKPIEITNKDSGIFYYPNQTVYYFENAELEARNTDQSNTYRLNIEVEEDNGSKKNIIGETKLIKKINLPQQTQLYKTTGIEFVNGSEYATLTFKFTKSENVSRYNITLRFNYDEEYTDGTKISKHFDLGLASIKASQLTGSEVSIEVSGETFFNAVNQNVPPATSDIKQRWLQDLTFIFSTAGEALDAYMEANEPATGLTQEKPEYTNLTASYQDDDSKVARVAGIFSTRYTQEENFPLGAQTIKELLNGEINNDIYRADKAFCNPGVGINDPSSCY